VAHRGIGSIKTRGGEYPSGAADPCNGIAPNVLADPADRTAGRASDGYSPPGSSGRLLGHAVQTALYTGVPDAITDAAVTSDGKDVMVVVRGL